MIPVNEPSLDGNEKKYLNECIDTGWISSEGPFVKQFEEKFAAKVGRKYGVAVSNGSVALDAAIIAFGLKEGDEVIMPTFTIISCAIAIVRAGLKPVLVDADAETWNMNVNQIESKITLKTRAIMVVHIYGFPVEMDKVLEIAKKYKLKVIEDAAEMHGQTYKGKPCGSFGDISIFSFYPNKHITTGEGGMIVMDDEVLAEKCKSLRNLCFLPEKRFLHEEMGYNFRMTNLQAAVGLAQLERLDDFVLKKRKMGKLYLELFKNIQGFQLPILEKEYAKNIFWVFPLVSQNKDLNAVVCMKKLANAGVGTRPFFYPMHLQPVFKKMGLFKNESYPVAECIAEQGFYLPSGLGQTQKDFTEVANRFNILFN